MTASYTNNRHQLHNIIIMLLLAEVTIILSMGLWNSIVDCAQIVINWAAVCVDSKCLSFLIDMISYQYINIM